MKKLFCIIIAMAMVFGLVACSSSDETATGTTTQESESISAKTSESASAETASAETSEYTGEEMTIKFSTLESESSVVGQGLSIMKDYINETTNGKVTVEVYFSNSLIPQDQEIDALMKGTIDMRTYSDVGDYVPEQCTLNIPFLFEDADHLKAFYQSQAGQDLFDKVAEVTGIRILPTSAFNRGYRTVNLRVDKKVTCRADLKGMKLRMPNVEALIFLGRMLGW